jgi:hypothetical protein
MTALLGPRDELLRQIEGAFDNSDIHVRGNEVTIDGPDAELVGKVFEELVVLVQQGHGLDARTVGRAIDMVRDDERPSEVLSTQILKSTRGAPVRPKSSGQKRYVDTIAANVVTFAIGAGLAAIGALMYCAQYRAVTTTMGSLLGLKAFVAAVLGGIGLIPGAMLGGILIGLIEALITAYISSSLANALVFVVLIIVLLVKPAGVLGKNVGEKV